MDRRVLKPKEDLNENTEGVEKYVLKQKRNVRKMKPVLVDTQIRTFILVPKDMPESKVERLKLKYKNYIEDRKL